MLSLLVFGERYNSVGNAHIVVVIVDVARGKHSIHTVSIISPRRVNSVGITHIVADVVEAVAIRADQTNDAGITGVRRVCRRNIFCTSITGNVSTQMYSVSEGSDAITRRVRSSEIVGIPYRISSIIVVTDSTRWPNKTHILCFICVRRAFRRNYNKHDPLLICHLNKSNMHGQKYCYYSESYRKILS